MLILATKGERPPMFADIATRKALHADRPAYTAAPAHVRTKIPNRLRQIRPASASLDARALPKVIFPSAKRECKAG